MLRIISTEHQVYYYVHLYICLYIVCIRLYIYSDCFFKFVTILYDFILFFFIDQRFAFCCSRSALNLQLFYDYVYDYDYDYDYEYDYNYVYDYVYRNN